MVTRYGPPEFPAPVVQVERLDPRARLPEFYDTNSIAYDVFAFLLTESGRPTSRAIHMKGVTEIPTGIKIHPPPGFYLQICSRVSLARKGIFVANAPALIPASFTGELTILLFNGSYETQYIAHEHRIAQFTIHAHDTQLPIRERIPPSQRPEDVHPGPGQDHSRC